MKIERIKPVFKLEKPIIKNIIKVQLYRQTDLYLKLGAY